MLPHCLTILQKVPFVSDMQDLSVKLKPLQIYIEDKYILHLKECLMNTLPISIFGEASSKLASTKANPSDLKQGNLQSKNNELQNLVEKEPDDNIDENNAKKEPSEGADEEDLFNVSEPDENTLDETVSNIESSAVRLTTPTYESESIWSVPTSTSHQQNLKEQSLSECKGFPIPSDVLSASQDLARPLRLRSLSISELDLLVSIHTSTRFYIALDHSPLQLASFKRSSLSTTAYRLGQSLTLHYFFGAIYGTGKLNNLILYLIKLQLSSFHITRSH